MSAMTVNTSDIDVSCDWLYKGKHRTKKKSSKVDLLTANDNNGNSVGNNNNAGRRRSTSVSNAQLSKQEPQDSTHGNDHRGATIERLPLLTPISSIPQKSGSSVGGSPLTKVVSATLQDSTSTDTDDSKTNKKPSRSKSLNNSSGVKAGFLAKPTASTTSTTSSNTLKGPVRSDSMKKSLFGSLFGKKQTLAGASTPTKNLSSINTSQGKPPHRVVSDIVSPTIRDGSQSPTSALPLSTPSSSTTSSSTNLQQHPHQNLGISQLEPVSLKRVTFSVNKFTDDPPQQLPSRNPRIGNVLIPQDMIGDIPTISMGISPNAQAKKEASESNVSDAGGGGRTSGAPSQIDLTKTYSVDSIEYKRALDIQRKVLKEAEMHQKEAHFAAKRIEYEVSLFKPGNDSKNNKAQRITEEDMSADTVTFHADQLEGIDKPIHVHEHHFGEETVTEEKEMTLDIVYTRCCHLREILPIPSTLKQVKHKTAPLQVLKFLNAKPTLIDILSFCDFVSITHINTVVFDNVNLTQEMFKIVIRSLANCHNLDKLTMKNVLIDNENWTLFCKFLLSNRSITKLDISQTNTKFISKDKNAEIPSDNEFLRHNLDWNLFATVLNVRKGRPIEELLLNGIKFSKHVDSGTFQNVLNSFSQQKNSIRDQPSFALRLGLASSDLSLTFVRYLLNWMSTTKNSAMSKAFYVQGVDTSFNDMSQYVKTVVNRLSALDYTNLEYYTLNSSNISNAYDVALIIKYLSRLPNLKFLDLSNCPQMFPDVLPYLHKYLPRFKSLKRIHVDGNDVLYKELSVLVNILTKCTTLRHISIMQNTPQTGHDKVNNFARNNCWAILYALVRQSPNLVNLDINYDAVPEEIQSRIALSLVSNMNKAMGSIEETDELTMQDDLLFDGSLLSDTAEQVFEKLNRLKNVMPGEGKPQFDSTKKYLLKKYFEKMQHVHNDVQKKIDTMFERRRTNTLSLKEKENLVRLLLLEKNFSNILELCNQIPEFNMLMGSKEQDLKPTNRHFEPSTETVDEEATNTPSETPEIETLSRPHLMATDSGRTVDVLTGKPVLFRANSSTLVHGKEQEQEEGELHKWGFFVQQQNDIYPDNNDTATGTSSGFSSAISTSSAASTVVSETPSAKTTLITKIPSGTNLRAAIIQAKGIDSINDLIRSVNENEVHLESIYGADCAKSKVAETYDKLLNDMSEGRNIKK
ncbi:similar to Saccharomyces cerevisiae YPL137C GIP3 Glc7-interacting protein whose overexpression relocalizes Glc7p from the nucleus and prevents chromosome segregation [Maudiozyma saulgeensis]|uniref:Similar to Saccharomyces cerevisiae YPL137C GIP3 Glc7-interacting protein whose overexpression relocalizes Glc7p from the nucleus and prevents chromosome segregation n=1 Tax=Maudiozyma saulgeensis TaxID=1789683 RepID=A0A1X7R9K4_9SACH|nr:similar to Saccharomyces cerevisiae YPL137C GIP3 Glc7-interacting protein whose overexpression relocalizes Glc7p from the nucleus and prevents chromosome segregation [Kazachstania saulgeensis]